MTSCYSVYRVVLDDQVWKLANWQLITIIIKIILVALIKN